MSRKNAKIHNPSIITNYLIEYKEQPSESRYTKLYNAILEYAYEFPALLHKKHQEFGSEFVLFIQRKVPLLIHRFQYFGVDFEGYLYRTFRGQFMSFMKSFNTAERNIQSFQFYENYRTLAIPTYTNEFKEEYNKQNIVSDAIALEHIIEYFKTSTQYNLESSYRRIWICLVKYCVFITDERVYDLSAKIGISHQQVLHVLNYIAPKRKYQSNKKINAEFECSRKYAKYIQECKKLYEQQDLLFGYELERLKDSVRLSKLSYNRAKHYYMTSNYSIPNKAIADALYVSKGVIDSAVYHFKKTCNNITLQSLEM